MMTMNIKEEGEVMSKQVFNMKYDGLFFKSDCHGTII